MKECHTTAERKIIENKAAPAIEEAVVKLAIEKPAWGQRVSNELRKNGLSVSDSGVRSTTTIGRIAESSVFEKRRCRRLKIHYRR